VPIINVNACYADFSLYQPAERSRKPFKVGVVGGVGPLATVDFMGKIVRLTEAGRDQDHIKMIVEQNPQIPDRTEHLVQSGTDPTIALFATCKKLEAAEADLIAIPCNIIRRTPSWIGCRRIYACQCSTCWTRPWLRSPGSIPASSSGC
jgi:aspartate racemase